MFWYRYCIHWFWLSSDTAGVFGIPGLMSMQVPCSNTGLFSGTAVTGAVTVVAVGPVANAYTLPSYALPYVRTPEAKL